jgi:hypothetical protein
VLLTELVDRKSFKREISTRAELRFDRSGLKEGRFHSQIGDAILHHLEFNGNDACHLDGAAEGDLTITLY